MSEIFLKLRIKEMLQGKMKRYLVFGVVEVFLVVAGILIALSINNWDNKKTQRREEIYIYVNQMEDVHYQFIRDIISRELLFNIDFSTDRVEGPYDLFSFQFHNLFLASMEIILEKEEIYQRALSKIDQTAQLIEEELKQ